MFRGVRRRADSIRQRASSGSGGPMAHQSIRRRAISMEAFDLCASLGGRRRSLKITDGSRFFTSSRLPMTTIGIAKNCSFLRAASKPGSNWQTTGSVRWQPKTALLPEWRKVD